MPPPLPPSAEVERFLQALRRSRLLARNQIDVLLTEIPQRVRESVTGLGEWFVSKELLTHFQVSKLAQGTYQGLALGPYHILSPLGKGGMGTVYLARDTRTEQERHNSPALVALKVLPGKRAREEERTLARFLREMDMARRVDHQHVTKTFEVGAVDGVHFIAMEYIRGISLRKQIADRGPLTVARAARFFAEVADGLQHAHEKGLIHRDLKPSNMMVTPNGHAKILDMGLALATDEELPEDKSIVGGQGYVVGTMDFIAPEQVDDPTAVDGRADLYALGCSLYMALTGRLPFPGGTSIEKMKRHRNAYPDPITDHNPTVSADFARIVERLMEKSPARRYASARQVQAALLQWVAGDPETPMDTDPHQSEAQLVQELEKAQPDPGEFFNSITAAVFGDMAKKYSQPDPSSETLAVKPPPIPGPAKPPPLPGEVAERVEKLFPIWLIILAPVVLCMIPGLVMAVGLRFLLK
ncbi:serine/threonine-protein kinase [Zavarzinella formosa]|uniref:serine/threonine-protein kinase n=1 Tax=Zavarzinella formosa TaxID=360055 RepID=UPI0012FC32CD|nr:serine/threonine-protein kinase [Zavarzinella formosa]